MHLIIHGLTLCNYIQFYLVLLVIMAMSNQELQDEINKLKTLLKQQPAKAPRQKPMMFSDATPEAWFEWKSHYQSVVDANGWSHSSARKMARTCMLGQVLECIQEVDTNAEIPDGKDDADDYMDLLKEYELRLVPSNYQKALLRKVALAGQRDDETIFSWHSRLLTMYKKAYPEIQQSQDMDYMHWPALVVRFIDGLRNEEVADLVRQKVEDDTDYKEALELADKMDGVWQTRQGQQTADFPVDKRQPWRVEQMRAGPAPKRARPAARNDKGSFRGRCYNCYNFCGYRRVDCPHPSMKKARPAPSPASPAATPRGAPFGGRRSMQEMAQDRSASGNE
jgi:hypothetical protein